MADGLPRVPAANSREMDGIARLHLLVCHYVCIWLFLLGWARILTGHFTGIEIAMTIIVGAASVFAVIQALRMKSASSWSINLLITTATLILQLATFRLSQLPGIADH